MKPAQWSRNRRGVRTHRTVRDDAVRRRRSPKTTQLLHRRSDDTEGVDMARPKNADIHEMPDRGDGGALTHRQRKVLEVIRNSIDRRGYPPSMREIGRASCRERV